MDGGKPHLPPLPPPPPRPGRRPLATVVLPNGETITREVPPKAGPYPVVYEYLADPKGITESLKRAMWNHHQRRYVERPMRMVKAELVARFTPRQIDRARKELGVRSEMRRGCWWWIPHQSHRSWAPPKPLAKSGMVLLLHPEGDLGIWTRFDVETGRPWDPDAD